MNNIFFLGILNYNKYIIYIFENIKSIDFFLKDFIIFN